MKKYMVVLLGLLASNSVAPHLCYAVPPSTLSSPRFKVDPQIWTFRTKVQAQGLIAKNLNDSKAMYYLINQSYKHNLEGYVANNLLQRLRKDGDNAHLIVLTSYACKQSATIGARGYFQNGSPEANAMVSQTGAVFALLTPEVYKSLKDPALIVMASAVLNDEMFGGWDVNFKPYRNTAWKPLLNAMDRAIQKQPRWADARYWHARILYTYHSKTKSNVKTASVESLRHLPLKAKSELLLAIQLDPNMKGDCYTELAFVMEKLGDYRQALTYFKQGQKLKRYSIDPAWEKRTIERFEYGINHPQTL